MHCFKVQIQNISLVNDILMSFLSFFLSFSLSFSLSKS